MGTFAERLDAYMVVKHMSRSAFADSVGIARSTVENWVLNDAEPNMRAMRRLVEATGISADWWLGVRNDR